MRLELGLILFIIEVISARSVGNTAMVRGLYGIRELSVGSVFGILDANSRPMLQKYSLNVFEIMTGSFVVLLLGTFMDLISLAVYGLL